MPLRPGPSFNLCPLSTSFSTVIIDDESNARDLMRKLLGEQPYNFDIVGEADDVEAGAKLISRLQPDLIFLDIQLKSGTGFDILARLPNIVGEVIFVTAYNQYAIRAFDFAALGYLLKPLRISDLRDTLRRFFDRQASRPSADHRLRTFMTNRQGEENRMVVADVNGFRVLTLPSIVYLRGEINYTRFFLEDKTELLSSKTLKEYERLLSGNGFCRIHQSYLVNISHVTSYQRGEGGVVILSNGDHLDVSRRRKAEFMRYFVR